MRDFTETITAAKNKVASKLGKLLKSVEEPHPKRS
jgi:hypothetical protein